MPDNILPITGLDKVGLIADTPPVALPAAGFSDCLNVRFKDGVVRKMEGEVNVFRQLPFSSDDIIKYVAWWPSPNLAQVNRGYYLVILEQDVPNVGIRDQAYFVRPGADTFGTVKGTFNSEGSWQHTFFQGGFALIINNGIDVPNFVLDPEGNFDALKIPNFAPLPGWDSYHVNEVILSDVFGEDSSRVFDTGQSRARDASNNLLTDFIITVNDDPPLTEGTADNQYTVAEVNELATITFGDTAVGLNDNVQVTLRSTNPVVVRAGVIRSFGDFLVAGNLSERDENDLNVRIRSLPGVVRSSDVAAPGGIPNNWNPFATGVSTADEFVITQEGIVQDLVELQSNLYIYSNNSISVMRLTGNAQVPLQVIPITTSYGCLTTDGVVEYDGKHVIVGSQDIYLFGGHPGSIQSIADARVRNYFYDRLNPLEEDSVFMLRYHQRDEIWICYASVDSLGSARDEALIWNYRNNTWTRRSLPQVYSGDIGPVPGGGLPLAGIDINGTSSNNNQTASPQLDQQELIIGNIDIPTAGSGHQTQYDIDVLDTIPEFNTSGPALFDIVLPDNFMSGTTGREIHMTFEGLSDPSNTGASIVFSFDVMLPAGLSGNGPGVISLIRETLVNDTDFAANFEFVDVDQTVAPGEFVIRGTNTAAVTTTLNFGSQRLIDRNDLTRDMDRDVPGIFMRDPLSTNSYLVTFDIPAANVRATHYLNIDPSTGARVFRVPQQGGRSYADMYDDPTSSTAPVYGSGRGGTTERPTFGSEQVMYRTRSGSGFTEIDITDEPFIPTVAGLYDFVVEYPDDTTDLTVATLEAYDPPAITNGTTMLVPPSARTGVPISSAPILTFETDHLIWESGQYVEDAQLPVDTLMVTLSGDFTGPMRRVHIANHIRDAFHNQFSSFPPITEDAGIWNTRTSSQSQTDTDVEIISRINGAYQLRLANVQSGETSVTADHFDLNRTVLGRYNWVSPLDTPMLTEEQLRAGDRHAVYPELRLFNGGSDDIRSETIRTIPTLRLDAGMQDLDQTNVANIIANRISMESGWELGTSSNTAAAAVQTAVITDGLMPMFNPLGVLSVQDIPASRPADEWTVEVIDVGNTTAADTIDTVIQSAFTETSAGSYLTRNTPSYLFLQIRNSEAEQSTGVYAEQELFIVEAIPDMSAEQVVEDWIPRIRRANPRFTVRDIGTAGQFSIQPNNYGELANFVLIPTINNTQLVEDPLDPTTMIESIDHCRRLLQASIYYNGTDPDRIQLHPASSIPFINVPGVSLTTGYNNFNAGVNDLSIMPTISLLFDTIRSWPEDEVNFNFEIPIFAARQDVIGSVNNIQTVQRVNKILGADIGWTTPEFSLTPTTETTSEDGSTLTLTGNDAPTNYESYIERMSLGLTPEFETEQLHSVALWADGSTIERFNADPSYNRLEIRSTGSNNPGERVSLTQSESEQTRRKNVYFVSEDYKVDLRTNGRFINMRISDNILDESQLENPPEGREFRQDAEWRISGIQLEVSKAGTR